MNKWKNWLLGSGLLTITLFLSGCVRMDKNGNPDTSGLIYRTLVKPMGSMITYLVDNFHWEYGWAIIAMTIVVRLIILPLGINQSKKSMVQAEKMQVLKPQVDVAQAKLKAATTREEQMEAQTEMQKVYKENGLSMTGGIGCLPLLIQMPIFSALYFTARYTEGIQSSTFLNLFDLGKPSLVLVAIAGVSYLIQGYISTIGIPEEQKKTMKTMLIVSPLMIVFMSISAPAGVTLYWVVGGIFSCLQTFITNVLMKPRIKAQVAEEFRLNPPKQVVTPIKDVTPVKEKKVTNVPRNTAKSGQGRNAGKQQRKK
ncbi:YidC/Oxa1 family membrane protein insertase [Enterococcus phoeniculicola]|jgi:YidC/Oxa1 family membrane protein insertase|uniref:Membrane protein insertase YidC n=1 Tax=Enterococcus phoeniculicola ATCC BAA-412 TaxID=1158610 RepID=R3WJP4_9ENTE|nr:membrane protein insertase YidC [Enterococcus phoeniculicola]EOL42105.1 YidC/Oxa1 family membrane protein insertase [Enterococcus phoeniculicola ATCC BAA-412]EOT79616.1 preprotein translocase subunit YidC [Enterococcus phoeniculicola ATCC BAA-412]OJG71680.1 YidC/Oxa1 family membrane protein insertase [Enterococcus phoeniculicola]